jgi:hypothetical protein
MLSQNAQVEAIATAWAFRLSSASGQLTQQMPELRLGHPALGDVDHGQVQDVLLVRNDDPVEIEERKRRTEASALVAVQKGLRLRDVKRVGSGHLEDAIVQVFATEAGLWLHDRRFKRAGIPYAILAAPSVKREAVKALHVGDREKLGHELFRQLGERRCMAVEHARDRLFHALVERLRIRRRNGPGTRLDRGLGRDRDAGHGRHNGQTIASCGPSGKWAPGKA